MTLQKIYDLMNAVCHLINVKPLENKESKEIYINTKGDSPSDVCDILFLRHVDIPRNDSSASSKFSSIVKYGIINSRKYGQLGLVKDLTYILGRESLEAEAEYLQDMFLECVKYDTYISEKSYSGDYPKKRTPEEYESFLRYVDSHYAEHIESYFSSCKEKLASELRFSFDTILDDYGISPDADNVFLVITLLIALCVATVKFTTEAEASEEDINDLLSAQSRLNRDIEAFLEKHQLELAAFDKPTFRTYQDLLKMGLTADDIAQQLYENDKALYSNHMKHFAQSYKDTWGKIMTMAPDNWGFICIDGTRIIGNFSFIVITDPEQEKKLTSGEYFEHEFSDIRNVSFTMNGASHSDTCAIYILNLSLNDGYQTDANSKLLMRSLGKRLYNLAKQGVYFRQIYGTVLRDDHKNVMSQFGFDPLVECENGGTVYYIDLTYDMPQAFKWIYPTNFLQEDIKYFQLSSFESLSTLQLGDIASLIWSTDEYIYPCLMTRPQALKVLPTLLMSSGDTMFSMQNIFVAMNESGRIIGVILYKIGPLNWKSDKIKELLKNYNEKIPATLDLVEKEYFAKYDKLEANEISILNFAVNPHVLDSRVGDDLMKAFIAEHSDAKMQLYVLQETRDVFLTYLRCGFEVIEHNKGFSADNRDLLCFLMKRTPAVKNKNKEKTK